MFDKKELLNQLVGVPRKPVVGTWPMNLAPVIALREHRTYSELAMRLRRVETHKDCT